MYHVHVDDVRPISLADPDLAIVFFSRTAYERKALIPSVKEEQHHHLTISTNHIKRTKPKSNEQIKNNPKRNS